MIRLIPAHYHNHGPLRKDPLPRWIVIHDAEAESAISVANFFATSGLKKPVSSHVVVDDNYIVRCVPDEYVAWTAGPNANAQSLQIELCGRAAYSENEWWDKHEATLYNAALVIAKWTKDYHIPLVWLADTDLLSYQFPESTIRGLTTHSAITRVLGGTDHIDPGPNFPLDKFLQKCIDVSNLPPEYQLV